MFKPETYTKRRKQLKERIQSGVILLLGNEDSPMNYPANPFAFRQDSTFLYYFGIDEPGFAALMDIDADEEIILGYDFTVDDIVWMGPQEKMADKAAKVGVHKTGPTGDLEGKIRAALEKNRTIHFLPQYRGENIIKITKMTGIPNGLVNESASTELVKAVAAQRSVKSDEEVEEIETALDISYKMNRLAMKLAKPGMIEREVYGQIEGLVLSHGSHISFPVIYSIHGETLHNHHHDNEMNDGDILVLDPGAESPLHYASDITRTYPVNGKFTERQTELYNICLEIENACFKVYRPGITGRQARGEVVEILEAKGIKLAGSGVRLIWANHWIGLAVHDDGPPELDTVLKPGMITTFEPMVVADKENLGVRVEDVVLVTEDGCKNLSHLVPRTVEEVEKTMGEEGIFEILRAKGRLK